ncbi:MAG: hypothetical protein ACLGIM_02795, partial [Alphaproteobacteria bacterium]
MVRSGEAFALPLILQNGAGENQDLLGRSFVLSVRLSRAGEPFLEVAGVLADDHLSVSFIISADDATAVYEAGLSRALQGDITEVGGTFRHSFPVTVDEGSGVPVDEPISLPNFPVTELVAMPGAVIVIQRGAQGYGAERRLYEAGLIDEPTVAAMDARYALAGAPFADAAAESAQEAEDQAAAALVDAERAETAAQTALSEALAIRENGAEIIEFDADDIFPAGSIGAVVKGQGGILARNIKEMLAANALTRAEMAAQIMADPTELTDDSAALEAAIRAAITTGQPMRLIGVFYVNTPINIAVDGRRVDLVNHGDAWIIGGPGLNAPVIKIANSSTVGGAAARSVAIRVSGLQFDVSKAPYGVLNSINCLNFSGFRDTIIDGCYFYHGEDYRAGNAGGDSGLFTTSNRIVFKYNSVIGAPDIAVYASGSQNGTQDNISLLSEGNNYIKCANAIAAKRNYRFLRSVGDHFDGCYNCITASPAGGTGDGQLCGSRVVVTGATFRNIIAKCFDPRSSSNWHGSGVISGTFGIGLDGATVANAAFIGISGSENCSFDIVGEVEGATDSTHAAVRITTHRNSETGITSTSRGNTVRATVKNIYNGLLEFAPCEKNTVELNLTDVTNPVT